MDLHPSRGTRRAVVHRALTLVAAAALRARPAAALRGWCRSDPLIAIDGELADIFATASPRILTSVKGPTRIVVTTPEGVTVRLIVAGPGFGRGEKVRFATSPRLKRSQAGIEIEVKLRVPARETLGIGVEFAPRILGVLRPATAVGAANEWVTLTTTF